MSSVSTSLKLKRKRRREKQKARRGLGNPTNTRSPSEQAQQTQKQTKFRVTAEDRVKESSQAKRRRQQKQQFSGHHDGSLSTATTSTRTTKATATDYASTTTLSPSCCSKKQGEGKAKPEQTLASRISRPTKRKPKRFLHGNYDRYYGYRHRGKSNGLTEGPPELADPRLDLLLTLPFHDKLFRHKAVLDIGCNTGRLTLQVALTMGRLYLPLMFTMYVSNAIPWLFSLFFFLIISISIFASPIHFNASLPEHRARFYHGH